VKTLGHAPAVRFDGDYYGGSSIQTTNDSHLTRDCMKGARQENGAPKFTDSSYTIGHLNSLNISAHTMMQDILRAAEIFLSANKFHSLEETKSSTVPSRKIVNALCKEISAFILIIKIS
jgi:hypothetical protein